jgi:hypothetical protein
MTDRCKTGLTGNNDAALAAFHAEVDRLMSLTKDAFADLDPDVLTPIVATIRATPSEVSRS